MADADTDKFVLTNLSPALATMQENCERDLAILRASVETLKRQPVTGNRDFLLKSMNRLVAITEQHMGVLSPARRMADQYHAK